MLCAILTCGARLRRAEKGKPQTGELRTERRKAEERQSLKPWRTCG